MCGPRTEDRLLPPAECALGRSGSGVGTSLWCVEA